MKRDWKKDRAAAAKHARLVAKRPELRAALYANKGGVIDTSAEDRAARAMSPAMQKQWDRPLRGPNILQQARDRAIGLDLLYPAQTPATGQKANDDG